MTSPDDLLTAAEVVEKYGVHRVTVSRWVKTGRLPAVRLVGLRTLRFRRSDVEAIAVPVEPQQEAM